MTRARSALLLAAACLVCGAAGWASRAELDEITMGAGRARIALVPSWQPLAGFTVLALVAAAGLAVATQAAAGRRPHVPRLSAASVALPLFALTLLLVPYLPVLPDRMPALQALAGPGRWLIWAVVLALIAWSAAPLGASAVARLNAVPLVWRTGAVWLLTAAAMTVAAGRLTHTVLFPSGDEPHYLIIAQSLGRDGDLKIENNHARGDYQEYFGRELEPHYLTRGKDGEIYSVHPIGMPLLITPVYALGGYDLVVWFFIAMTATAATVAWRWVVALTDAPGTATLAWAAMAFSAPLLINSFTIYPEIPAALVVIVALALTIRPVPDARAWPAWVVGALAATLPWLSTKYAPMSAALVAVAAARRWWPAHAGQARASWVGGALPLALPYGLGLAAWFGFFYAYWGTVWPQAPYGRLTQTQLANTVFGVPGLLFDQEYGLVMYAPVYVLAGFGLWTMLRRRSPLRRLGLEIGLVFAALLVTVGAFRIWWGGSAAPGRPLVSGLLPLMLPLAVQLGSAAATSSRRAAQHALVWLGIALSVVLVVAQDGLLLNNDRDGAANLLDWLSPRWPLWSMVPSFIAIEAPRAIADTLVWLAALLVGRAALSRVRVASRGAAALAALACGVAVVAIAGAVVGAVPHAQDERAATDLRSRARLAALDAFDRVTRPLAVQYAPLRVTPAVTVEPALALAVEPGLRRQPQAVRVLHNGRFSLPAGRYAAVVRWADRDPLPARTGTIGLQVGRIGPPLTEWPVAPSPGGTWRQEFWLPVDAGFVALRGTPELERAIAEIRFEAIDVVDAGVRTDTPQVLAAAAYGSAIVLFHDEQMYPEPGGFWTTGKRLARLTIACPGGCAQGVRLEVHSGKRPNHLRLSTRGWSQELDLTGETLVPVEVPPPAAGNVIVLDTITTSGFVPIDIDPAFRDRRYLGAWIQVAPLASEAH